LLQVTGYKLQVTGCRIFEAGLSIFNREFFPST
jgi:hypothetical protein